MTGIPPQYSVLVSKSILYYSSEYYFYRYSGSSLLSSSVKWIQTSDLGGDTFYAAHVGKEIYNSLQSPVSHTHLFLPTIISSTSLFCLHLSFQPHSTGFVFCLIDIFFYVCFMKSECRNMTVKAQEDTKHPQKVWFLPLTIKDPMLNTDMYSKQMHAYMLHANVSQTWRVL